MGHDKAIAAAPRELKIRYIAGQTGRLKIRYIAGRREYDSSASILTKLIQSCRFSKKSSQLV